LRYSRTDHNGYTLVELTLVVLIIAVVLTIAMPRLGPQLAFSRLEGAARHVASYGQSAVAHCALNEERITVQFELSHEPQEYWCLRWPEPETSLFGEGLDGEEEQLSVLDQTEENVLEMVSMNREQELAELADDLRQRFDRLFRYQLEARTRNVTHDGFLADVGPDFSEFDLDLDAGEAEEVKTDLLARTTVPEGVVIESMRVGGVDYTDGVVEIDVTPVGLFETVEFRLRGEDDEYFTVVWDPITLSSRLSYGLTGAAE
jgi:prepilin-type N-terminal cleavage/methylation domain-containing protein